MNEIINDFEYGKVKFNNIIFTKEEVIKIVDACFHAFASSYRKDAKEMANNIMNNIIKGKELK